MSTGCPRTAIHEVALQLLQVIQEKGMEEFLYQYLVRFARIDVLFNAFQVLDARFFGTGPSLPLAGGDVDSEATERGDGELSTLDALLATTYSRSQMYLSRQLAQLHPELTMPMFSGTFVFAYL